MLELKDVNAGYGQTQVLRDVSIRVPEGKVVALLGANGAGKTTLLRVASRLIRVSAGSVTLHGKEVSRIPPQALARRGLCYIPDGVSVFRSLSVRENLFLFAARSERKEAVGRAAALFPVLGKRLGQLAGTLSGGEQQMLALARAQLSGASIVLLDEVSTGLAPKVVDEMFDALRALAGSGMSLLLVEQYVQRALAMSDHIYLLQRGEVIFSGPPSALDSDELTRSYVGADLKAMTS
jgi:branched-chain amino acid transport system ATP-binding protein